MKKNFQSQKIGLLGGGQLGRMLLQDAIGLDLDIAVLDPDEHAPCRRITNSFTRGDFRDEQTVYDFGKSMDVLTIEIENVNTNALKRLEKEGKKVFPQPHVIELIQDKGLQKLFYKEHEVPTAEFVLIENKAEISAHGAMFPVFQKLRKGGYDGRGVTKLKDTAQLSQAFDAPSVLEKAVNCDKEISVIVSRNADGVISAFPVVECEFSPSAHLVEFLFSPAEISSETEREAISIAKNVAEKLGIIGLLAVEMFVAGGKILVNEIAPRPHNSGHHTIEACDVSQFGQYLRAILGLEPGNTSVIRPAVMVNLLGEPGYSGPVLYKGLDEVLAMSDVHVHLYGKKETRPNRKMGHVTILAQNMQEARSMAMRVKQTLKVIA
jgi:5-(carboxyamino)imidazole ribonucleotide synthase